MDYFECDVPPSNGICSDNSCPCPEVEIPKGKGYLYIEQSLVDFRRQYPSLQAARNAMQQKRQQMRASFGGMVSGFYRLGPILVCEQGAKLRNLDLEIAGADAKHWWATGQVPLRATPLSSTKSKGHTLAPAHETGSSNRKVPTTNRKPTASSITPKKKWWHFWK